MLRSMTGFGEAQCQRDGLSVSVEIRTINNRYFKLVLRTSEGYSALEPLVEEVIRHRIRRGTIQVTLRVDRARTAEDYRINLAVLGGYRKQLDAIRQEWNLDGGVPLETLLLLPGVVEELTSQGTRAQDDWPVIRQAIELAMEHLDRMRAEEGRAMAADLLANASHVGQCLDRIAARAPLVIEGYRQRLEERIRKALEDYQITVDPSDLLREVSLFTERSDISEEVVRLKSHLEQFAGFIEAPESCGRKLEFLTQEMFREANTIGSKANDVEIAREVIQIKTALERIREMIQNVE